jgi:hypothetical protein
MTTTSLIIILNVTMLLVNATVSSVQSIMIYKETKRNADKTL